MTDHQTTTCISWLPALAGTGLCKGAVALPTPTPSPAAT